MDDNPSAGVDAGAGQWCDAMLDWTSDHMGT
jgi:hypothetical protein